MASYESIQHSIKEYAIRNADHDIKKNPEYIDYEQFRLHYHMLSFLIVEMKKDENPLLKYGYEMLCTLNNLIEGVES